MSTAAGLGAFGFWLFIASIVVAGIWYDARRKESQQETLRRIVESGRDIDPALIDRIIGASAGENLARDLKVGAYVVLPLAPGMAMLAVFLGMIAPEPRAALLGVAILMGFIGTGLLLAAKMVERHYSGPAS